MVQSKKNRALAKRINGELVHITHAKQHDLYYNNIMQLVL